MLIPYYVMLSIDFHGKVRLLAGKLPSPVVPRLQSLNSTSLDASPSQPDSTWQWQEMKIGWRYEKYRCAQITLNIRLFPHSLLRMCYEKQIRSSRYFGTLTKYYNSQPLAIDFLRCYPYLSRLATQIIKKSQVRACNSNLEPPKYELEVWITKLHSLSIIMLFDFSMAVVP